ncbi:MAG: hypothetical protein QF894_03185, partial [Alphaproteobacteria bacterium]|nr:hypothetical protein [Alphaproteobacteria bacterium]
MGLESCPRLPNSGFRGKGLDSYVQNLPQISLTMLPSGFPGKGPGSGVHQFTLGFLWVLEGESRLAEQTQAC